VTARLQDPRIAVTPQTIFDARLQSIALASLDLLPLLGISPYLKAE